MDEATFGDELRRAVGRLERDDLPDPAVRERAAARMREAYARRVAGQPAMPTHAEAEIAVLIAEEPPRGSRWRPLGLVAAVILLVGLLTVGLLMRDSDPPIPADEPQVTSTSTTLPVPRGLGAGTITTDVLGPRLTMRSDVPLRLLRAEPGLVEFGFEDSVDDQSTLAIVRPQGGVSSALGAESLEALLQALPSVQEQPNVVAGRPSLSWRLLDPGGTDLCPASTCLPLFDGPPSVVIPADRIVDVFEFPLVGDETGVLIVTNPTDRFGFDHGGSFVDAIRSIEIDDVAPAADPLALPRVDVVPAEPAS